MRIEIPVMYRNGVEIDGGSKHRLLATYFAHPTKEADMFNAGLNEFLDYGEFEFVYDNDVYVLKNEKVDCG